MATITTIDSTDLITDSRSDINTNFANLNSDKIETSYIDTDTALTANSDVKIPSQKAVKSYIDTQGGANASETVRGVVEEATDAEVTAGTATGATGAKLIVTPAKLATRLTAVIPVSKIYISTTEVTFTNGDGGSGAGTEHTCFSTSIAGGSLGTNNCLKFKMYIKQAMFDSVSSAWTIRIKYGGSTLATLTNATLSNDSTPNMHGYLEGYIFGDGSTSVQKITATCWLAQSSDSEVSSDTSVGVDKVYFSQQSVAGAVDSTSSQTLEVSVQMTNNSANDGTMDWFIVEKIA